MPTKPAAAHAALHRQIRTALAEKSSPDSSTWSVSRERFVEWVLLGSRHGEEWTGFRQGAAAWAALARLCPTVESCDALPRDEDEADLCLLRPTTPDPDVEPEESARRLTTKPFQGPNKGFSWTTESDDEPLPVATGEFLAPPVSVKQLLTAVRRQAEAPQEKPTREDAERLRLIIGAVRCHELCSYPNFIGPFAHLLANGEFGDDTNFKRLAHPAQCDKLFPEHFPEELFWTLYAVMITGAFMYTSGEPVTVPLIDAKASPEGWLARPVLPPPPLFTTEKDLEATLGANNPSMKKGKKPQKKGK